MSDVEVHVMPTRVRIARLLQESRSPTRPGYALLDILGPVLKSLVASEKPDTFFELILDCAPPSDSDRHPNGNAGDAEEHADESKRVVCEERQQLWKPAVSLVLDEDSVGNFRADSLESFKDSWRPIKILEASGGVATDQLVSMLRPLSKSRISIMNISTFNEDFLLCDDERTDEVVHSISTAIRGEPDQPPLPLSPNSLRDIHDGAFVLLMPHRFVLLHHPADAMPEFAPSIMQVLLACADGDVDHGFVSVTRIAEEVSWIMPRELFHKFEASALATCIGDYRGLQLRGTFSEHSNGVVDSFCAPLADAECEVLSMSSYWTNTMLVREEDVEAAVEKLQESGFRVERGTGHGDNGDRGIRTRS
mmetsp:Transcript_8476/g.16953  ORF Transcript_8476/g.16953 Transcript_8476/m.16953 type:complete len:364 (-) Transcript_8476:109-1200(-)|eukprot:CAMPEP_0196722534 /NCGR_PEP_ID=MMETSP1091-20130531/4892_1 /TAXON_ID=302021 /ORGANISM="Rhodomonas sp., Strain CCMP768" /LENGTH=363 /DNA_ID=CAMNT_0042064271 /DNA_START=74 /DNA_END=1165 /DNA_ORIENTATION=-